MIIDGIGQEIFIEIVLLERCGLTLILLIGPLLINFIYTINQIFHFGSLQ